MNNIATLKINAVNMFDSIDHEQLSECEQQSLITLAMKIVGNKHKVGKVLSEPADASELLILKMADQRNEMFGAIFLTTRHAIIDIVDIFQGTVNGASVHPRVVVQHALEYNASAVILYHNHPSGDPSPSKADELITHRLKNALEIVDVRVLDHIVVGGTTVVSFAERGIL